MGLVVVVRKGGGVRSDKAKFGLLAASSLLNSMDEKIFSDLEQKIVKRFTKKDAALFNQHLEDAKFNHHADPDLFLSLPKLSMLIYGKPEFTTLSSQNTPLVDIHAPVLDGMFPLHLAVLTSSTSLVRKLVLSYRAKIDVRCSGDPHSPFYALTPLELALKMIRYLIPWTPQMPVHDLLSMFHANDKVKSLMLNISTLLSVTPRIRHVITDYSLQGKVVELAVLLKEAYSYPIDISSMYIPTANMPSELHFGGPLILRMLVANKSASLIKEGIQISASLNPEESDYCRIKIREMDCVRTLLESARRGDLHVFDVKQQLTVELTDGVTLSDGGSEGSQDASKVNTVAPQYLKNSLFYVEPSKFVPPGVFNSLMPRGYNDRFKNYDGLDIRNGNALAETIFRVLDGRKVDDLGLEDACLFKYRLESCLRDKFKEAETLMALEKKEPKQLAEEKRNSTLSLPHTLTSLPRTLTAALKPGVSYPLSEAFKHLDVRNLSSSVFSAIKKGKA